jgi:hypothetical protein
VYEKLIGAAERAATAASRRQFLGRFGRAAMAVAAAGGALTAARDGMAGGRKCGPMSYIRCVGQPVGTRCGADRGGKYYCYTEPGWNGNCSCG